MDNNIVQGSGVATGAGLAYTATLSASMSGYVDFGLYLIEFDTANTGAVTLNINSLGVKDLKKSDGSAVASGDITIDAVLTLVYNGTHFRIVSSEGALPTFPAGSDTQIQFNESGVHGAHAGFIYDNNAANRANLVVAKDGTVLPAPTTELADQMVAVVATNSSGGFSVYADATRRLAELIGVSGGMLGLYDAADVLKVAIFGNTTDSYFNGGGDYGFGLNSGITARVTIRGISNLVGNSALLVQSLDTTNTFEVKNNGNVVFNGLLYPTADGGGANEVMITNGAGTLSFVDVDTIVTHTPAGADTQVQFNNSGAFGANANLTYTANALTLNDAKLDVTGEVAQSTAIFKVNGGNSILELLSTQNATFSGQTVLIDNAVDGVSSFGVNTSSVGTSVITAFTPMTGDAVQSFFAFVGPNYTNADLANKTWIQDANNDGIVFQVVTTADDVFEWRSAGDASVLQMQLKNKNLGVGTAAVSGDAVTIRGTSNANTSSSLRVENLGGTDILEVRDDRKVIINGSVDYNVTTVTTSTYNVAVTDYYLWVTRTATGTCAITLPTISVAGRMKLYIMDSAANSGTFAITVNRGGTDTITSTITGQTSYTINSNGGVIELINDGTSIWKVH